MLITCDFIIFTEIIVKTCERIDFSERLKKLQLLFFEFSNNYRNFYNF